MEKDKDTSHLETIVVGAGPAGVTAARRLQLQFPGMPILVLESGERSGGNAVSGLHLIDAALSESFDIVASSAFEGAKIRWERAWVSPEQVNWKDKEWIADLPQWAHYLEKTKRVYLGISEAEVEVAIKGQSPVSKLTQTESSDGKPEWLLETPTQNYQCKRLIWAAGLTAFQNAFGKHEAQAYLVANPRFQAGAQDFRGGIGLEMSFSPEPAFEEGFDSKAVFGLPVKHNGQRYLTLGAVLKDDTGITLRTLTHAHRDLLMDPKEVASLQKSLRRALRSMMTLSDENKGTERWVVSSKVGGHSLGLPWLLGTGVASSIEFVGEESIAGLKNGLLDTLGALDSVDVLHQLVADLEVPPPLEEGAQATSSPA